MRNFVWSLKWIGPFKKFLRVDSLVDFQEVGLGEKLLPAVVADDRQNVLDDKLGGEVLQSLGIGHLVGEIQDLDGVLASHCFGDLRFAKFHQVFQVVLIGDE